MSNENVEQGPVRKVLLYIASALGLPIPVSAAAPLPVTAPTALAIAPVTVGSVTAGKLQQNKATHSTIVCAVANQDYSGPTVPNWATYVVVWADNTFIVAEGESTAGGHGWRLPSSTPLMIPLSILAPGKLIHGQSPTAGTVISVNFGAD